MKLAVDAYLNKRNNITLEVVGGLGPMPQTDAARQSEECAVATASQPPDAAHVQEQILTGGFPIHSDRCGITKKSIQVQMGTIRRNLVSKGLLAPDRTWSTLCQTELLKWLNSPKDGRSRKMVPPASASSVAAAPPPALPALDHMRKSSSSSSSTSDDSSSSSEEDHSSKAKVALTKSERQCFEELLDAVKCHQEIESQNACLERENKRLKTENKALKEKLKKFGSTNK